MRTSLAGAGFVVVLALGACAAQPELSDEAAGDLQARVAAVREAVAARDPVAAGLELQRLRRAVRHWKSGGEINEQRAERVLAAIREVDSRLALLADPISPAPRVDEREDGGNEGGPPEEAGPPLGRGGGPPPGSGPPSDVPGRP